ncbi:hypothetical protein CLOHYLEM_04010 [[Clostridium] hylemonae DSM 15053]|uniref:UPF0291 protein CLOHYLEM_04010 n=2 Tax=[Clostridium] hylemonae TaxID=89153 RepID=C0BW18_9FIRM|nr:hypothetical protein CLOHYLEM_04010 [[Clostridium] hylemonae DSM 15053]
MYYKIRNFHDFRKDEREMDEKKIARINELYHKSKAEGLTEAERKEQQVLRREYVDAFKQNLRSQLNQISIEEADGTITELGEKFGKKRGN